MLTRILNTAAGNLARNLRNPKFYLGLPFKRNTWVIALLGVSAKVAFSRVSYEMSLTPLDIASLIDSDNNMPVIPMRYQDSDEALLYPLRVWQHVLFHHEENCKDPHCKAVLDEFFAQFDHLRGLSKKEQLQQVDAIIDDYVTYEYDEDTYGYREYWASPIDSITRGQGDCEDYAILKFFALKHLGWETDRLFLLSFDVEGKDSGHLVLAVDISDDPSQKSIVILDNNSGLWGTKILKMPNIYNSEYIEGYSPRYIATEDEFTQLKPIPLH